jgi:hypothetical protein
MRTDHHERLAMLATAWWTATAAMTAFGIAAVAHLDRGLVMALFVIGGAGWVAFGLPLVLDWRGSAQALRDFFATRVLRNAIERGRTPTMPDTYGMRVIGGVMVFAGLVCSVAGIASQF